MSKMLFVFVLLINYSIYVNSYVYLRGTELLSDVNYTQGFSVIPACPTVPTECDKAPRYRLYNPFSTAPNASATWIMAQWASHSNITTNGTFVNDGKCRGMQWSTDDKRFILFEDDRLQLSVNGFHEYGGKYKARDAPWVHLLLQQDIGIAGGSIPLSQVNELRWNLNVQLLHMDQHIQPGYDPNLHAGQFPLYMTIQNLVRGDPEYGKYFWLGIGLYDDRVLMSPLYVNGDKGTGSLIYSPAFSNFANVSVHSGNVVHVTGDMMPFVRLGLQAAFERQFLNSTDLNKYYVGGMNIGWEVTGLNNGTIEIGDFSLKQYTAQNPKSYEFNHNGDTEGWTVSSNINTPSNGLWILPVKNNDVQLLSPIFMLDTSVVKTLLINTNSSFRLFWSTNTVGLFDEMDSIVIDTKNNTNWHEHIINLSENINWKGVVRRLRLDPLSNDLVSSFGINYIRFADH